MTPRSASRSSAVMAPVLLGLGLLVTTGAALSDPDNLVETRFTAALDEPALGTAVQRAAAPVAGSEAYWLSNSTLAGETKSDIKRVSWSAPVAAGERIRVTRNGKTEALEVVTIAEEDAGITRIDTGADAPTYLLTCRDSAGELLTLRLASGRVVADESAARDRAL